MAASAPGPGARAAPLDPRDPLGLASDAPLLAAWLNWTGRAAAGTLTPMSTPGHKQRPDLAGAVVAGDAPLYGGLDAIKHADHLLAGAQARAAALWGAGWCRFSVAGSTHGNQAFCLAIGQPGQEVIITRTLHRSLLLGLVLAGLRPVWVRPDIDPRSGLPAAVPVQTVRDTLAAHPAACGVILGDPPDVGTTGYLRATPGPRTRPGSADRRRGLGGLPRPPPDLPPHAIAAGADALVTSVHKTLPAYTEGALLLARTERLDVARLNRAFEAIYRRAWPVILASIDAAVALLAGEGPGLAPGCCAAWRWPGGGYARCRASTCSTVRRRPGQARGAAGRHRANGNLVESDLIAAGMPVEMGDRDTVIPIPSIADDEARLAAFTEVMIASIERHRAEPRLRPPRRPGRCARRRSCRPARRSSRRTRPSPPRRRSAGSARSSSRRTRPASRCWPRAS